MLFHRVVVKRNGMQVYETPCKYTYAEARKLADKMISEQGDTYLSTDMLIGVQVLCEEHGYQWCDEDGCEACLIEAESNVNEAMYSALEQQA